MDNEYGRTDIPNIIVPDKAIEKYWGSIQTILVNDNFVLKNIFMRKGTQSSLEYHVYKNEYYYLLSGKLKIGMRIGRAKNVSIIMNANEVYYIPKGLMHMRIALEDCVIIELSNVDSLEDSNIVEDGKIYIHKEK